MIDGLQAHCDNRVFVPTYDPNKSVVPIGDHVLVSQCFRKWDRILFAYKQRKIIKNIESSYEISDFDMLHGYTLFSDGNVAYTLHKKYGIPYVVAVRNTDVNSFFKYRPHLRGRGVRILHNAAAVFFLSASYRDQVIEHYVPKKYREEIMGKAQIIPNGIDPFWFTKGEKHGKPEGNSVDLVFAGNINRNKNILTAAESCRILRQRGYDGNLTVIGKIADPEVAEELKSIPYVKLFPGMTKEELAQVYGTKDIFVMPSYYESFGLVYAEAMSQGLPVLYTRGQGFDGQFPEGFVGYSVNPKDPKEIADRIEQILKDYEPMSARCIDNSKVFRWEAFATTYYDIYKRCKL